MSADIICRTTLYGGGVDLVTVTRRGDYGEKLEVGHQLIQAILASRLGCG
jgi:hypothetical protein